ncbi:unnamed protein product, partial [Amoebophrya sp. A25]
LTPSVIVFRTFEDLEHCADSFFEDNKDIPLMIAVAYSPKPLSTTSFPQADLDPAVEWTEIRRGFVLPKWWSPDSHDAHLLNVQNRTKSSCATATALEKNLLPGGCESSISNMQREYDQSLEDEQHETS